MIAAHNINNTFGPGTADKHTAQWWFKKFYKGDESLESEGCGGWPSEATMSNWEPALKLILLQLHEKLPKNSASVIPRSFDMWSKLERWKSAISGCPVSWQKDLKKLPYVEVSSSLIQHNNNKSFLNCIVMCDEKWILYNRWWTAQLLGWEEAPRHFPKSNLYQKKVMVTVWWSAAGLIHYSSLNPGETITSEKYAQQSNEMHRNLQHLRPGLVNRRGLVVLHDNAQSHVAQPVLQNLNQLS